MNNTTDDSTPDDSNPAERRGNGGHTGPSGDDIDKPQIPQWLRTLFKSSGKSESSLREAIEEYIVDQNLEPGIDPLSQEEHMLLANILKLRDLSVFDIMVPRADIAGIDIKTTKTELFSLLAEKQFSRLPVYRETLDDVVGTIHIKDIMAALAAGKKIDIKALVREVPIVSPAMPILDLLLQMRETTRHMALVVDEFGGIDGLVTIGDVIETIVGQMSDEHDQDDEPTLDEKPDGTIVADARVDITEFEDEYGSFFNEEERDESDTLGGLVSFLAGRVPARGEVITHSSGMVFEVMDADPRRINRLRIRKLPEAPTGDTVSDND